VRPLGLRSICELLGCVVLVEVSEDCVGGALPWVCLHVETRFLSFASLPRYKKLEDLLEKSFSLVKMPSLQPVVMCVMKHLPKVSAVGPAFPRRPVPLW
jgi:hypothetical protein